MLPANLHFVPPSPASAVGNQLSLEFRKTSQDVFMGKALQFRHLGVNGLPFSLFFCRDSTVQRDTRVWELIILHCL
jgi:hypothetical protein